MKREDELSLEEWDKVFQSMGDTPFWFTISGGEPFMNKDIVEMAQSIYKHCHPGIINIPTNSLMHKIIQPKVATMCETCPDTQFIINLSLDGVGDKHDHIRGIAGNFEKFEANYRALRELDYPNLSIGIHSVISRFNVDDVRELYDYAFGLKPDSYITEIAEQRVELDTVGISITPPRDKYSAAIDELIARVERQQFRGISQVTEAFRVRYYKLVKRILAEETQVIPCYAGWASAQIYANGDVWACCVRADNMLNLRSVDYDFKRVWFSKEADTIRASIKNKECHCPLANASYTNMLMHAPTLAKVGSQVAWQSLPIVSGRHGKDAAPVPAVTVTTVSGGPK
jgi:MoaA/NifB/PqqE/SkfB family radical SAM enzyme